MPSFSSPSILRGLSLSQIQRCIPRKWKEGTKQFEKSSCILETTTPDSDSVIHFLLTSIKNYVSQGHLSKAFKSLSLIKLHGSCCTSCDAILHSISSLLLSCTSHRFFPQGKQLHAYIVRLGLQQHPIVVPKLVTYYSSFNLYVDAYTVIETSNMLHPLPWNVLISSYVKNGHFVEALTTYKQMVNKGIRPDCFTYPSVLKACGEKLDIDFGMEVHKSISSSCDEWNLFVHNSLVSMYGKFGLVDVARQLFDRMPQRDVISWNAMISGYASKGMLTEASELFGNMEMEGIERTIILWNAIAGGCLRTGNLRGALDLLSQMRMGGIQFDSVAFTIGLSACSHLGSINIGKEIHGYAIRSCCEGYENVRNALITMYSRCEDLTQAYNIFQLTEDRTIITWTSMISGYCYMDRLEDASLLFREMLRCGMQPNYVTISCILPLCACVANLQHGKEFHCYIIKSAVFDDCLVLWNTLLDMYARSGRLLDAERVLNSMTKKDKITYTSMILGYGMQGKGKAALKLFEDMIFSDIQPDHVTMVSILSACSHSRLVIDGERLFQRMLSDYYGIDPGLEHYSCMVDLYGRAGLLNKAKEIITRMPYRPTSAMWATLIGACKIHKNTEIEEWATKKLLEDISFQKTKKERSY